MHVIFQKKVVCRQKALWGWVGSSSSKTQAITAANISAALYSDKTQSQSLHTPKSPAKHTQPSSTSKNAGWLAFSCIPRATARPTTRSHFFACKEHHGILKVFSAKFLSVHIKAIPGLRTYRSIIFKKIFMQTHYRYHFKDFQWNPNGETVLLHPS